MTDDLPHLRSLLGASTALWAGRSGVRIEPGRWLALSGAGGVDYNVAFCHGTGTVAASREEIVAAGAPGLLMLAGTALGEAQVLVEAGWACVGSVPFMSRPLKAPSQPTEVGSGRRLGPADLDQAHGLIAEVFGIGPDLARVAVPGPALEEPGRTAWGAFEEGGALVAFLATVRTEDAVCIWSMATSKRVRRRGHGARLLEFALAESAASGARRSLLHASPDGEPFYKAVGYSELERWQLWSRPRWVLGRA